MDVQLQRQNGYGVAKVPGNASPAMSKLNTEANGLAQYQTVMILCGAKPHFALTVVDLDKQGMQYRHVELAPANPVNTVKQHWIKDDHWGVTIKDDKGRTAFAIVNTVTGEAIQHPEANGGQVRLVPYNPTVPDNSVLWTEEEAGKGFCYIREMKEIHMPVRQDPKVLDAVDDGKRVVVSTRNGALTQHWKIQRDAV